MLLTVNAQRWMRLQRRLRYRKEQRSRVGRRLSTDGGGGNARLHASKRWRGEVCLRRDGIVTLPCPTRPAPPTKGLRSYTLARYVLSLRPHPNAHLLKATATVAICQSIDRSHNAFRWANYHLNIENFCAIYDQRSGSF